MDLHLHMVKLKLHHLPLFQFGGTLGLGNPLNKPKEKENTQSGGTTKLSEQYRGTCGGIHNLSNTTFPGVFQFGSKVDNSGTVKALYDELSVIRIQIEHLTKATDNIFKIISRLQ